MSSINQPIINCLWIRGCHDFSSAIIWFFYSIRNSHISFSHIRLRAWVGLQVDEHVARMLWLGMQSVVAISSNCPWMAMCLDSLDMLPYGTIMYIYIYSIYVYTYVLPIIDTKKNSIFGTYAIRGWCGYLAILQDGPRCHFGCSQVMFSKITEVSEVWARLNKEISH